MIINKINLDFQIQSGKPNENWLKNDEYYVLGDKSELAKKFLILYPFAKIIADDDIITDIVEDTNKKEKFNAKLKKENQKNNLQNNLKETNEKIVECFEWFMGKMLNYKTITDLPKLFDYSDFPYNLKDILKERQETREKIRALNGESEE